MAKCLTEFSHVSVREESVREILQPQVSNPIMVTVDPTILCGRKAFDNVASKRLERKPYICVYAYTPDEELVQKTIKTIPNYTQFEVHYILFSATKLSQWKNKTIHSALTIEDFLSYIKYASYIVTNSFHGLAFSLLFERNFNVTWMDNKSTRTEALLKELKLSNRLIRDANNAKWSNLDYKKVNVELDMVRNESREYLSNSIND